MVSRSIEIQLRRFGETVEILTKQKDGVDAHNNPDWSFTTLTEQDDDGNDVPVTLPCVRTYPNRNEEHNSTAGPFEDDDPVFFFLPDQTPPSNARIVYPEGGGSTTTYEMEAPTPYPTHVAMFGQVVNE